MRIGQVQRMASELIRKMTEAGFKSNMMRAQQVMCMAEEAGEAVKAARRYMGLARTPGTLEELREELADVVIASAAMAEAFGIDLETAVAHRMEYVMDRPVRAGRTCESFEPEEQRPGVVDAPRTKIPSAVDAFREQHPGVADAPREPSPAQSWNVDPFDVAPPDRRPYNGSPEHARDNDIY